MQKQSLIKNLSNFFKTGFKKNEHTIVYCMGKNKEGVKCSKALSCARYVPERIKGQEYIEFPEKYPIENCEIFSTIKTQQ